MERLTLTSSQPTAAFSQLSALSGRLFLPAGTVLPPVSHDQDEISFILSGRLRARSGGQDYLLSGGDVTLIPAGEVHSGEVLDDLTLVYVLLGAP